MRYKTPRHFLAVLGSAYNEFIETPSGFRLHFVADFNPTHHATVTGRVIGVPVNNMTGVVEGDEIIFNYLVVSSMDERCADPVHEYLFEDNGQKIWQIDEQFLLGHFRGDGIVPKPGLVFMNALADEVQEKTAAGLWIPEMSQRKKIKGRALVRYVGAQLPGADEVDVVSGDVVFFDERFVQRYTIKGVEYLVLDQSRLLAKQNVYKRAG